MIDWDESNEHHIGILSDWDLASLTDELNKVVPSHLKHHTGTVPFMSINLLSESPPHRYCHDLESFFYILVCASVHFNVEKHRCERPQPKFLSWNSPDLEAVSDTKTSFMTNSCAYERFVKGEFWVLFKTWVNALWLMFHDANHSREGDVNVAHSAATFEHLEKSYYCTWCTYIYHLLLRIICIAFLSRFPNPVVSLGTLEKPIAFRRHWLEVFTYIYLITTTLRLNPIAIYFDSEDKSITWHLYIYITWLFNT